VESDSFREILAGILPNAVDHDRGTLFVIEPPLENPNLGDNVDTEMVVRRSSGSTSADFESVRDEAGLYAMREGNGRASQGHLLGALQETRSESHLQQRCHIHGR